MSDSDNRHGVADCGSPKHVTSNEELHKPGISRRSLLRAAVVGAAGLPLASGMALSGAQALSQSAQSSGGAGPQVIPEGVTESWAEPWIWRPSDWPGQQLNLQVVENENPGPVVGPGNPTAVLFSYNGMTPGPTIRMRGDEILFLRLRNLLGENLGTTSFGPFPDLPALPKWVNADDVNAKIKKLGRVSPDFCLGEHTNGVHTARDTNLHTHGVHVRPGRNPDGTHSDNVILRLITEKDLEVREAQADAPGCEWLRDPNQISYLRDDEQTGYADYEFRIGDVQAKERALLGLPAQPHPPGTHWYHPHSHGATHNQVACGMVGFLIIEGDVDEAINEALTGEKHPDPQLKTGAYDYIERVMLIQRVFVIGDDPDAATKDMIHGGVAGLPINGDQNPAVITMRPGAIERWRILNGSVDGKGFLRLMVLKGQYAIETEMSSSGSTQTLVKLRDAKTSSFTPATRAEVTADKQGIYQLAFDGITLVQERADGFSYTIKNLAEQNAQSDNPLDRELTGNPNQAMLANLEACFADADSVKNCFIRPNEVDLAPANRTDLFFQAPRLPAASASAPASETYTVVCLGSVVHSDDYQSSLMGNYTIDTLATPPEDIVVAYVVVSDGADASGDVSPPIPEYDVMELINVLPPVPQYLQPVTDDEVQVREASGNRPADGDSELPDRLGKFRTRTKIYSGWGSGDFPLVTTAGDSETARNFKAFIERDQANGGELELMRYAKIEKSEDYVLLAPALRTMAIANSRSDEVIDDSDPLFPITRGMSRKFDPNDPERSMILESTAEEWALHNASMALWADTAKKAPGQGAGHFPGQPLLRVEGQAKFAAQPDNAKSWTITSKGVDHPFHMHQNPFWVMRIEVPDQNGNLVNILDQPRWQDVVWIPRSGGRVIFRSRFPDFIGTLVNHCHILLHEDHGMMQPVEIVPFADQANYEMRDRVASNADDAEAVNAIYPPLDPASAWLQDMQFIDPNHMTGQTFPGFVLGPPPE